jgi:hypothetical protein
MFCSRVVHVLSLFEDLVEKFSSCVVGNPGPNSDPQNFKKISFHYLKSYSFYLNSQITLHCID